MPGRNTHRRMWRSQVIGLLACCLGAVEPAAPPVGLAALNDLDRLPLLMPETLVHYVGSIDKSGGDAGRLALAAAPTQGPLDLGGARSQKEGQQPFLGTLDEVHLQRGAVVMAGVPGKPATKDARTVVLYTAEP